MKRSKKSTQEVKKINFYFRVVDLIRQGKCLSDIAKELRLSKQLLNYKLLPLKKQGILNKIAYGVWEVNEANFKKLISKKEVKKGHNTLPDHIRGHAYIYTCKIPKIKKWEQRKDYLIKNNIEHKDILQGQRITLKLNKDKFKVWLCKDSIVIYFPKTKDYNTNSAEKSYLYSLHDCNRILIKISSLLNIKLSKNWRIRVSRQHYSLVKNKLAKKCLKEGRDLFIQDKYGVLWALVDNSKNLEGINLEEFEMINTKTAVKDTDDIINPFFNDLRDNPKAYLPSEATQVLNGLIETSKWSVNNINVFAENLASHVKLVQEATQTNIELREQMTGFVSEMFRLSKVITKVEEKIK